MTGVSEGLKAGLRVRHPALPNVLLDTEDYIDVSCSWGCTGLGQLIE